MKDLLIAPHDTIRFLRIRTHSLGPLIEHMPHVRVRKKSTHLVVRAYVQTLTVVLDGRPATKALVWEFNAGIVAQGIIESAPVELDEWLDGYPGYSANQIGLALGLNRQTIRIWYRDDVFGAPKRPKTHERGSLEIPSEAIRAALTYHAPSSH